MITEAIIELSQKKYLDIYQFGTLALIFKAHSQAVRKTLRRHDPLDYPARKYIVDLNRIILRYKIAIYSGIINENAKILNFIKFDVLEKH